MARLWMCGFENQSVTAGHETTAIMGAPSISTTTKRSGNASMRCNATADIETGVTNTIGTTVDRVWIRAYIYIASLPSILSVIMFANDSGGGTTSAIALTTSGTLQLWSFENTLTTFEQKGSSSAALSLNTWYRVELSADTSTNTWSFTARLDGTQFASASVSAGLTADTDLIDIGVIGFSDLPNLTAAAVNADIYVDDIAVNDNTGSAQTSFPGEGSIVHARPTAAGDNAADSGTFADVDDVTPDDATTLIHLDNTTSIADYNMTDSSTLGIDSYDTITLVQVGVRLREEVSTTTSYQLRIKSASGGTTSTSTASDAGNTTFRTNPSGTTALVHRLVSYTDPTTGSAWTPTGTNSIDNMQVGVASLDADNIDVTQLWAAIEYVDGSPPGGSAVKDIIISNGLIVFSR